MVVTSVHTSVGVVSGGLPCDLSVDALSMGSLDPAGGHLIHDLVERVFRSLREDVVEVRPEVGGRRLHCVRVGVDLVPEESHLLLLGPGLPDSSIEEACLSGARWRDNSGATATAAVAVAVTVAHGFGLGLGLDGDLNRLDVVVSNECGERHSCE